MTWFDIFIAVAVIATLLKGFYSGFAMQLASLAGLVVGFLCSGLLAEQIKPQLLKISDMGSHIAAPLSYVIAFLVIFLALILIGRMLHSFIKVIQLGLLNRLAGSVFCTIKWVFILSILLNIYTQLDQDQVIIKEDIRKNSYSYPLLKSFAPKIIPYLKFNK